VCAKVGPESTPHREACGVPGLRLGDQAAGSGNMPGADGSRPSSRASGTLSRAHSGGPGAASPLFGSFPSRPSSRGDPRPTSAVQQVEGDGGFDSRPPSRSDVRPGGAAGPGQPLLGIQHVFGDGGFDSRPSSRGDVRPGSRPMSGIIKEPRGDGDMLAPMGRKGRLKSASRVTFPEAPGAVQIQVAPRSCADMPRSALQYGHAFCVPLVTSCCNRHRPSPSTTPLQSRR